MRTTFGPGAGAANEPGVCVQRNPRFQSGGVYSMGLAESRSKCLRDIDT